MWYNTRLMTGERFLAPRWQGIAEFALWAPFGIVGEQLDHAVVPTVMQPLQGHIGDFFFPAIALASGKVLGGDIFESDLSLKTKIFIGLSPAVLFEGLEFLHYFGSPRMGFDPLDILSYGLGTSLIVATHFVEKGIDKKRLKRRSSRLGTT